MSEWRRASVLGHGVRMATLALVLGLGACAAQPIKGAYVGVFTGEFVDGLPLYRLPAIEVVGSRRGMAPQPDGT